VSPNVLVIAMRRVVRPARDAPERSCARACRPTGRGPRWP
jgi:hypothetical protein